MGINQKSLVLLVVLMFFILAVPNQGEQAYRLVIPLGLDEFSIRIPQDNPLTTEKVELGRYLFFDKRLSNDGTIACASCHTPKLAFTDGQSLALGIQRQKGLRNTPTIINRVFASMQLWDGRVGTLEEQVKLPLINPIEMGNKSQDEVVDRLKKFKGYRLLFKRAFGTEDITIDHVAKTIASFERTLMSANSAFDKFEAGGDEKALSESAKRGLAIFRTKGECSLCHGGFNFTDELYHNIGIGMDKPEKDQDLGRFAITKRARDRVAFRTPTLREISKTAPYMHDGRFKTLEEVIDFYDKGGIQNPFLDSLIHPLKLTIREKKDLVAFLKSLEGEGWDHVNAPDRFPE